MTSPCEPLDLHVSRPSVYLDQWVWIRLARAASGEPREPADTSVLRAVQDASSAGVAFPLSVTHYMETAKVTDPRQRATLARTMALISRCRTLRNSGDLLRHQFLHAMYLSFSRPAFRPTAPEALGVGVWWAFNGKEAHFSLFDKSSGEKTDPASIPGMQKFMRLANQFAEFQMFAGPRDDEIEELRSNGYRPEAAVEATRSRLEWEEIYVGLLADDPISRHELRVRVQVRELLHEHSKLFNELLAEYRLDLHREVNYNPDRPNVSREGMVAFADRIPSLRIAVDLKIELFRNASKTWTVNALHDIDAMSMAVPYCHVVVPDKEMASLMARSKAGERNGTQVLRQMQQLPDVLSALTTRAREIGGDASGWAWAGPGEGFCIDESEVHSAALNQPCAE